MAALPQCTKHITYHGAFVPSTSGGNINCGMGQGAHSLAVGTLQATLNQCYGAHLTVDNAFGTNTTTALRAAQREMGVGADGQYGPETRSHMKFIADTDGRQHCRTI